jgi:2-alkenal reductase
VDLGAGAIGDVIVAVNGKPVRRLADLTDVLEQTKLDATVDLTVVRDGSRRQVSVGVVDISRS